MFYFEWLLTIYAKVFNQDVASRVLDLYFLDGHEILFTCGLAILKMLYDELIIEDLGGIMEKLSQVGALISDGDSLVREISDQEVPEWIRTEIDRLVN